MKSINLFDALYSHGDDNAVALLLDDGSTLTRREMRQKVNRYAQALCDFGVGFGDRVSFLLQKSPNVLCLAHACVQIGAVIHPLNTGYTDTEIEYLIGDIEPRLFVHGSEDTDRFAPLMGRLVVPTATLDVNGRGSLGDAAAFSGPLEDVALVEAGTPAAILYTSGTTGQPKGAEITHGNLVESARQLVALWKVSATDQLLHALPVFHAHGLLTSVNVMLSGEASIRFMQVFTAVEAAKVLATATIMMGVPTHYSRLVRSPGFEKLTGGRFRLAISGSAPLPLDVAQQFSRMTGHHIVERYGSTEAAIVTAFPSESEPRPGWVGMPLPGVQIRVRQADGTVRRRGGTGTLETAGHHVFAGYWKRTDATREVFTEDGWFITGDIAEVDESGCVRLIDRAKDIVISGGLNVYPREVETHLEDVHGIAASAVFGVPHPDFGEAVVAAVEIEAGSAFDERYTIEQLRAVLAAYKVPKRIVVIEVIPRNRMGKVLKTELRNAFSTLFR
ncbi:AMP-binding protein [Paraburkholderia sp. 22B1P]|uniref:AMP-binding protein n=1 Tax=Paraburkholderia sp. 22B1P TaxID=3080498 RepID=UPI00309031FE|nr:AMP-binding protein [Paraburkholderia sp. 22B1P]